MSLSTAPLAINAPFEPQNSLHRQHSSRANQPSSTSVSSGFSTANRAFTLHNTLSFTQLQSTILSSCWTKVFWTSCCRGSRSPLSCSERDIPPDAMTLVFPLLNHAGNIHEPVRALRRDHMHNQLHGTEWCSRCVSVPQLSPRIDAVEATVLNQLLRISGDHFVKRLYT